MSSPRSLALWRSDRSGVSGGGCEGALSRVPAGLALGAVEEAQEAGVGARCGPGSGPRPRPALSAVLPRSAPMLIFGLGRPCPGISRHASRRPVCRPEPGGRREADSGGGSSAPECAADPPAPSRALPRSLPGYGRGHHAARFCPWFCLWFVAEDITVMSAFNLLHLVTKSQPVALRACGLPSGCCLLYSLHSRALG
ncbi:hypothetical protein NN561_008166 [Cricetulus griseus]